MADEDETIPVSNVIKIDEERVKGALWLRVGPRSSSHTRIMCKHVHVGAMSIMP